MPASTAPNPDLALWIAGLGFLSSLAVVLINAMVTMASKKIDVEQKKNEQEYGYNMEYLKRKLTSGERAIGQLEIAYNALTWLSIFYIQDLNSVYFHEETSLQKSNAYKNIYEKMMNTTYSSDNTYAAYFSFNFHTTDENNIFTRCNNMQNHIAMLVNKANHLLESYKEEQDLTKKDELLDEAEDIGEQAEDSIREYLVINKSARENIISICEIIRNEMKDFR